MLLAASTCALARDVAAQNKQKSFFHNPFSRGVTRNDKKETVKSHVSDKSSPKFALPKLPQFPKPSLPKMKLPSWGKSTKDAHKGPSAWEKMRHGTSNFFSKTKQILMPWADDGKHSSHKTSRRVSHTSTR
jgi:hypothetical protein